MVMSVSVWALPPYTDSGPSVRPPTAMTNLCHIPHPNITLPGPFIHELCPLQGQQPPRPILSRAGRGAAAGGSPPAYASLCLPPSPPAKRCLVRVMDGLPIEVE